ncbi:hypothetical protein [Quadrisphaera sp. KR29]|uniref:hypothetical protein n=1 Tax=Quadrisphaera sp. KR29 TaxID=3461391 RepID=UPI0040448021
MPEELPAPYEQEAPVDDVALLAVALGVAALLVTVATVVLPGLQLAGWLVAVVGLGVCGLALRRPEPARRAVTAGVLLSGAALLLSAVLAAAAVVRAVLGAGA